jgi:hypothetical protein
LGKKWRRVHRNLGFRFQGPALEGYGFFAGNRFILNSYRNKNSQFLWTGNRNPRFLPGEPGRVGGEIVILLVIQEKAQDVVSNRAKDENGAKKSGMGQGAFTVRDHADP